MNGSVVIDCEFDSNLFDDDNELINLCYEIIK